MYDSTIFRTNPSDERNVSDTSQAYDVVAYSPGVFVFNPESFMVWVAGGSSSISVVAKRGHILPGGSGRTFVLPTGATHVAVVAEAGNSGVVHIEGVQTSR